MGRAGRGGGGISGGARGGGGRMGGARGGGGRGPSSGAGRAGRGMGSSGGGIFGGASRSPAPRAPSGGSRTGGGFGGGMMGGVIGGMMGGMLSGGMGRNNRRRGGFGGGMMGGGGPFMGGPIQPAPRRRNGCGGCSGIIAVVVIIVLVLIVLSFLGNMGGSSIYAQGQITRSTIRREALPANAANDIGPMYTDHLGWIRNSNRLNNGLRNFHQRTGVRPHLYIVGSEIIGTSNPTDAQLEAYALQRHNEMFTDQAHLLFLFFENEAGVYWMNSAIGAMVGTVMDAEAMDILMDYVDFYYSQDVDEDEMFARAFDRASERIMNVERSPWIPVLIVAGVVVLAFLLFNWWRKAQEQKNREAEQRERMLSQPLESFGNDEATRRASRYTE